MLEVEPTGQRSATGSSRNDNEAFAGAASKTLARGLHHQHAAVKLP